jgi:hypothetical protein
MFRDDIGKIGPRSRRTSGFFRPVWRPRAAVGVSGQHPGIAIGPARAERRQPFAGLREKARLGLVSAPPGMTVISTTSNEP